MKALKKPIVQYTVYFMLSAIILWAVGPGCGRQEAETQPGKLPEYASFRDVPGVTEDEIRGIEALQEKTGHFVYGMPLSTEAFYDENGEIRGFSVLFCEWLTDFFNIPFQFAEYEFADLVAGLASGEVDFTGELTATEERLKTYLMTDPIAERTMKCFRIANSPSLEEIAASRLIKCGFIKGTNTPNTIIPKLKPGTSETVFVDNISQVHDKLQSGEIDAFFYTSPAEANFTAYADMVSDNFYPLIYRPVSLSAQDPGLAPIISVIQKALENGGAYRLNDLYQEGDRQYLRHKLSMWLDDEEKAYIRGHEHTGVAFAADHADYPVSFYNEYEGQWQGIVFDVLPELEALTGLSFHLANDRHADWTTLYTMLERGEAAMISNLLRTEESEERFLWPDTSFVSDYYALLSKTSFPNIDISEVRYMKVGLAKNTAYAELFRSWFPEHTNTVEYEGSDAAFQALDRGEVDLVMSSRRMLLDMTNYLELSGYKINVMFKYYSESAFGFNGDEAVLRSIVSKALHLIDTETISERWTSRLYDYQAKLTQAQIPWYIGASALILVVFILLFILFRRTQNRGKELKKLVDEQTSALQIQTSTLNAILDSIPDIVFCKDLDLAFTRVNKSAEAFYGVREADILGKNETDGVGSSAEILEQHNEIDRKVTGDGLTMAFMESTRAAGGGTVIFDTIKTPLMRNGQIIGLLGIKRDVTRYKEAEEAAQSANRAKSEFLATMSHEIRTPMNAILGITEILLRDEELKPDMKEALTKIYNSGDLLLSIINDILDLSKIEAGKLELLPHRYETASLINDTMTFHMMRIGSKPIIFSLSVDENTPSAFVGDDLRIKQILNNLLSNAFKYTERGTVDLSVSSEYGGGDTTLVFCVSDTGQGMAKEQVDKLFDEYSRFNAEANRTTEGTGLGMSITKKLVEMMGGSISVQSEINRGTTVTVKLRQEKASPQVLGKDLAESLQNLKFDFTGDIRKAQVVAEPMPYGKVLIVDDVESNLYVARGLLAPYGLSVTTVTSGFGAIDQIKNGNVFDIVFMDHMMPVKDGMETTGEIRGLGYTHTIVALTANAVAGQAELFLANGFDDFISKPIDMRQLAAVLKKYIRDKQPPEVIEAARQWGAPNQRRTEETRAPAEKPAVDPQLIGFFIKDAANAMHVLDAIDKKQGDYQDEDIRLFTTTVHAMKSALGNIGEPALSAVAAALEQAGRDKDMAAILSETPQFLAELRAKAKKLSPSKEAGGGSELQKEDYAFLQEKLPALKEACAAYDRKAEKAILSELTKKAWPQPIRETLGTINELLLGGDREKASGLMDGILHNLLQSQ